jgi:acyl-CoA synthetase (AMP-forming)/AMP-acid ligase II
MAARAVVTARIYYLTPSSTMLTASGFHHVAGLGLQAAALAAGTGLVLAPQFSIETWRTVRAHNPTHALLVPTVLQMLLDGGELVIPSLKVLIYGAAPIHPQTLDAVMAALPGIDFVQAYGQTESSPMTSLDPGDHVLGLRRPEILATAGRAVPGLELELRDCDENGVGEVTVRAAHVMEPGSDGWRRTGDLGVLDDDGYLRLLGRLGDKIIRGGENIMPLEIETVLETHQQVAQAAVIGVPDVLWGETVKAFIVAEGPDRPDFDELAKHVRSSLAGFKVPTDWAFISELPRGAEGKLQRRRLR